MAFPASSPFKLDTLFFPSFFLRDGLPGALISRDSRPPASGVLSKATDGHIPARLSIDASWTENIQGGVFDEVEVLSSSLWILERAQNRIATKVHRHTPDPIDLTYSGKDWFERYKKEICTLFDKDWVKRAF